MDASFFKIKVYKIYSPLGNRIYIGSTENDLNVRYANHICDYKKNILNPKNSCSSKFVFMWYGVENCKIELLGEHIVESKLEQRKLERLYYEMYKLDCVNRNRPYTSDDEKKDQMKKLGKEWYEKYKGYKIQRSLTNYYKKKNERIICDRCGTDVCKLTLKSHQNSNKCKNHNKNISSIIIDLNQLDLEDGINQNQMLQ